MSLAYKVEELLALRDSVSESAVSIDRFADEDVIKEHVLRPSVSANVIGSSSEKLFPSSTTPAIAAAAPNKKPSPSPSVKRGKAERLLKEHGSPPGMRVTAGGRVVPSDLPPLNTVRFGNNSFKPQALRSVTPSNGMSAQAQPDANNAPRLQVYGSQPVIWVGDRLYALPAYNPTPAMPSLVPPVVDAAKQAAEPAISLQGGFTAVPLAPQRSNTHTPFTGLDLQTLKQQQTFKKQELRTVEQTEVLQASHQSEEWRTGMIEKKRNLIVELDVLRRQISAAETEAAKDTFANGPATAPLPSFVPQLQQPIPQATFAIPQTTYPMLAPSPYPSLMMYPPPYGAYQGGDAPQFGRDGRFLVSSENQTNAPQSPGSASRRSHAIEIKPPRDEAKKHSALDPKSPTYEPVTKVDTAKEFVPPMLSPAKHSPWHSNEAAQSDRQEDRAISQKRSLSSIDTTDFFPTNTHEHSSTRIAPKITNSKESSCENTAVPSTPEKAWLASPWNPRNSSNRSGAALDSSWPEAIVKQPSIASLRPAISKQHLTKSEERSSLITTEAAKATFAGPDTTASRQSFNQRTGTDENWPLIASKPISHVPSTYQEGYQAGYDHIGLPDSHEFLQGFIQGMIQSMEDGKKGGIIKQSTRNFPSAGITSRSASLRGLLSSATPHDSAVSMTFSRTDLANAAQENIRSAKANAMIASARRDSAYSPQGSVLEAPISYTLCNEAARDSSSDKIGSGYRLADNEVSKKNQDKGIISRADSSLSHMGYPRQFSGNQYGNRAYGTPVGMQRYYPSPKEYVSGTFGAEVASCARPCASQRLSGLDGAMDDLAGVVLNTHLDEQPPAESADTEASCFKTSSSSKGKQKVPSSPTKSVSGKSKEPVVSSPANVPGSPKKTGEHSPAKAKLEQVTNKFRRGRKDDPRTMSPEDKKKRTEKWHNRFRNIKNNELKDIGDYMRENPRTNSNDGSANQRR